LPIGIIVEYYYRDVMNASFCKQYKRIEKRSRRTINGWCSIVVTTRDD